MRSRTALALLAIIAVALLVQLVVGEESDSGSSASPTTASQPGTPAGEAEEVPVDGVPVDESAAISRVLTRIDANGPFPYSADGEVFENREERLPDKPRGFYHAYTVPTPGSEDRGARRIITGEDGELYYTSDHYESFKSIDRADSK